MSKKMRTLRFIMSFCLVFSVFAPLATTQVAAANPVVQVANETQIRDAVANATEPTTVELTSDIQLTSSALVIPAGKDIELTGNDYMIAGVGGRGTIEVNGDLTLIGPTITHRPGLPGTGVLVSATGVFVMESGEISNNKTPDLDIGGGVTNNGIFTMNGGKITNNTAPLAGGFNGAGICNTGSFFMTGGEITNNTAVNHGGGIFNYGSISVTGGKISNNTADVGSGGGIHSDCGTIIIQGGEISNNTTGWLGGGIYIDRGTLTIQGGEISNNTALNSWQGGGGIYKLSGTITMQGGKISNNTSAGDGGGIYNSATGAVTISGGEITGNTAGRNGGGIYNDYQNLNMTGGKIANNIAKFDGGGIYDRSYAIFMAGGEITGNTAGRNGGGMYTHGFIIAGTISDNHAGNDGGGIYTLSHYAIMVSNGKTVSFSNNTARYAANPADDDYLRITNQVDPYVTSLSTSFGTAFTNYDINYDGEPLYRVTAKAGDNGTATPTTQFVAEGTNAAVITMTPDAGYEIDTVTLKIGAGSPGNVSPNIDAQGVGTYTVTNVNENCEVTVTFKEKANVTINYQSADPDMGTVSRDAENLPPFTGTAEGSTAQPNTGYVFVNWTNSKGDVVSQDLTFIPTKVDGLNVADTYTANFEADKFKVHFDYDGGIPNNPTSIEVDFGKLIMAHTQFPASITKAADKDFTYTFAGWEVTTPKAMVNAKAKVATNNKAGLKSLIPGELLESADVMPANDVFLIAKWDAKKKDLGDPKLSIDKKADKSTIVPGEKLSYTITITNKGAVDAKDIVVKDYLPKYTTYDSSSPKGTLSKENGKDCVTWTIASLKAGKSFKINLTVIVDKDIPKGHSIENIASYTGADGENTVTGTSNTAVTKYDGKPQTGDTGSPSLLIVIVIVAVLTAAAVTVPVLRRKFKGCN